MVLGCYEAARGGRGDPGVPKRVRVPRIDGVRFGEPFWGLLGGHLECFLKLPGSQSRANLVPKGLQHGDFDRKC